ncbi:probable elongator complex protein 2 [Drosophila grimshawi]|uniref:Elongator complex protein 2 n=1 Tax=Drosophila grimshawi TaxID=7222 RepID=B4J7S5_DROGR|nr:probable elongator complex protein 2 [Drosophila grimshawi]EDW01131.1 GH21263 [Drosophila grimshawi]
MQVTNLYTSVACNRTTECADWGPGGLIAYGACNAVAVLDPRYNGNSAKILFTLVEHTKRVNTVKWLDEYQLISGADDGNAVLWQLDDLGAEKRLLLKGHESGVNAVDGVRRPTGVWLLATAAADNSIKVWQMQPNNDISCLQTIQLAGGFCFSLRLKLLPKSEQVFLAFSSDDETVSLYAEQLEVANSETSASRFELVHKLSGHEDWVRALDFVYDGDDMLLASGSQDNFIRLWRIAPRSEQQVCENRMDILDFSAADSGEIRVEEKIVQVGKQSWYAVSLESVLYGHEGWIYGVHWHKNADEELRLLSASIDKTVIVWAPTEEGVWLEQVRVGEVGGNSMGFFGGKFAHDGRSIMAHSYQGGFHIWNQSEEPQQQQLWTPNVIVGGHYGQVRDLAWEHEGAYLMTVSADQTTRLHAPWLQANKSTTWHELARPQVHGYDMQTLALLSRYKFASGAEEKIVRTFQAPANFIENFRHISGLQQDAAGDALLDSLPKGASVPSLGLSNKAVYKVETESEKNSTAKNEYPDNYFVPITLQTPPQEETLMQNTLWPELQKLYGHGYELYALAATPDGQLLASTCRASNAEHAQIIIWNTANWKQLQKLSGHQLTVTQLRFSPDARYLLSVSRDRRWSLYERQQIEEPLSNYALVANSDKSNGVHTRIIWSCDWSHDGKYFATSSRDGKVVAWTKSEQATEQSAATSSLNGWQAAGTLELKNESITAISFAQRCLDEQAQIYLLALGTESGIIKIYQFTHGKWQLRCDLNKDSAHHLTVKRLQFRPGQLQLQLASCGEDHLVRIYDIKQT